MLQGSMVALVTPMTADGGLDEVALRGLVDWHVAEGTDAIVAVGTTGESATLDEEEHCYVIRLVVELAAGRIAVTAGTGANSTTEGVELTGCAKAAGADACLLVTPYYNKPTQQGLYLHHKAVAEAVDIPQILYNVPGRTGCDMLPETVGRLAAVPNIVGVKEATGDLARVPKIRQLAGPDFAIYSGDDATARELMALLGRGALFHDLGKAKTHDIEHGHIGAEIGKDLGLPKNITDIMEKHIRGGLTEEEAVELGRPVKDYSLKTLEEKIVIYADRLVDIITDGIVNIGGNESEAERRFEEILKEYPKYGKNYKTLQRYFGYHQEIQGLIKKAGA